MIECKKLRISEIRREVFIIERHDLGEPGKWIELNLKGEPKQDVFVGNGLVQRRDESEYKNLKDAEKAMSDFLLFPRVVMTNESESFPVYHLGMINNNFELKGKEYSPFKNHEWTLYAIKWLKEYLTYVKAPIIEHALSCMDAGMSYESALIDKRTICLKSEHLNYTNDNLDNPI